MELRLTHLLILLLLVQVRHELGLLLLLVYFLLLVVLGRELGVEVRVGGHGCHGCGGRREVPRLLSLLHARREA